MADEDAVRMVAQGVANQRGERHRADFGIDEPHAMARIEQRSAQRQQAERRQMVVRHPAADGGMRRIDQDDVHADPL